MRNAQLADLIRPKTIEEIVGQAHLFGERGVIRRMLAGGRLTNMIFFGHSRNRQNNRRVRHCGAVWDGFS